MKDSKESKAIKYTGRGNKKPDLKVPNHLAVRTRPSGEEQREAGV